MHSGAQWCTVVHSGAQECKKCTSFLNLFVKLVSGNLVHRLEAKKNYKINDFLLFFLSIVKVILVESSKFSGLTPNIKYQMISEDKLIEKMIELH